jgi:hypothetical protein
MTGIFREWQPIYAGHGIATVPVEPDTKIARLQWQKVGMPASTKMAKQARYADYGIGFACGARNRVTGLDIDTPDESLLRAALERHGPTPIIEQTASGKFHAWYRYNGEPRSCRQANGLSRYQALWGEDVPIDLLGRGLCVVTPTTTSRGAYRFLRGGIEDIPKLPVMQGLEGLHFKAPPAVRAHTVSYGRRNNQLYLYCMRQAHLCADRMALVDMARDYCNEHCEPPLSEGEIMSTASSAWGYHERGDNRIGQHGVSFRFDEAAPMLCDDQDAFLLLAFLRLRNGPWAEFMVANGLVDMLGWRRQRLADARHRLIELGYITQTRRATQHAPALFRWRA